MIPSGKKIELFVFFIIANREFKTHNATAATKPQILHILMNKSQSFARPSSVSLFLYISFAFSANLRR